MIYADCGINWTFPYEVLFEDDCILILKELPRQRKGELTIHVDKWIEHKDRGEIWVDGIRKLFEVQAK